MSVRKKKKGHKFLVTILIILSVLLVGVCVLVINKDNIMNFVKQKVVGSITKKVITEQLESIGAADLYEQIEASDKEAVENMIADYVNTDTVEVVKDAVLSGDLSQVQEVLTDNISEDDKAKLYQLYEKYKDKIQ